MSKQAFNKSTKAEIDGMRSLYKEGQSLSDIGRMYNRHHTTVMWWVGKLKNKNKKKNG